MEPQEVDLVRSKQPPVAQVHPSEPGGARDTACDTRQPCEDARTREVTYRGYPRCSVERNVVSDADERARISVSHISPRTHRPRASARTALAAFRHLHRSLNRTNLRADAGRHNKSIFVCTGHADMAARAGTVCDTRSRFAVSAKQHATCRRPATRVNCAVQAQWVSDANKREAARATAHTCAGALYSSSSATSPSLNRANLPTTQRPQQVDSCARQASRTCPSSSTQDARGARPGRAPRSSCVMSAGCAQRDAHGTP